MICLALPFSGASQQQGEQSLPNKSGVLDVDVLQQDSKTESAVLSNPEVEPTAMSTMSVSDETDGQVASASGAIVIPSLYTGVANVSVPLYTVQLGNISLPIGLNYITSGIKVRDIETWVGLG